MKASTQYNDFIGTAAADISDHINLEGFLNSRGVDTDRYTPIGANFYHGYADFFSASIICIDSNQSTDEKPYIVQLHFEGDFSHIDFFNLFKRFDVLITKNHEHFEKCEIHEEITIDNCD